ncbi:MAG TPA: alpha-amylase family glycosyl hydrolase, partial [Ideonella sp.]|nr:alpha-amylase family glycosyl hydrolase [Ideonella sp.]
DCPSAAPTFGDTVLYLRGTMNNWGALDDYAFQYSCDAYYLNVKLSGRHEFKLADAAWSPATSSEAHTLDFNGEHTLRAIVVAGRIQVSLGPKTFVDPNALPVAHPVAQGLRHDSRALVDKRPFGAVPAGTLVEFGVSAPAGVQRLTLVVESRRLEGNQEVLEYAEQARLPMKLQPDGTGHERWTTSHRFADKGVHGYWFDAEVDGRHYVVQNNSDAVFWTREKGSNGLGAVGVKPMRPSAIRRFRLTVYDPAFTVPDWAADAVYYYIFPDRYRNGNPANDPKPGTRRYQDHGVELHTNWNDRPWKPGTGDGSDAVYNNDFFGGDLAGIIEKLDDIRDLGANTIYMTPVFEAASNHKYDTADYHRIDPAFGSNADFERLTHEAAKRGIRVIPDASLNHVGSDSIYFNRYGNFGQQGAFQSGRINPASPYAGWFRFDPAAKEADKQYRGWVGVADLPELDKGSRSFRDFAYGAKDSVMKVWLDRGAAGWRMDVAPWVPDDFWREWRAAIKAHRPDALTIAETWFDASKYFVGDMFDSTMNYVFRNAVLEYAAGGDARVLYGNLELLREAYPPQALHALMNLLSTHDQARSLHVLGGPDGASTEAMTLAKRRLLLAVQFQMAYPGSPAVYYGDEVGVSGGDDPYNRATYPWPDRGGQPDLALRAEFRRLIALRHAHPVLRRGTLAAPVHVDAHSIALARRLGREHALTATNNAEREQPLSITLPAGAPQQWRDAQSGEVFNAKNGRLGFTLPALGGRVLLASAP